VTKLFERAGKDRYPDYVRTYVDRYLDDTGTISSARPWPAAMGGGGASTAFTCPSLS
jgi:hypothetical protein